MNSTQSLGRRQFIYLTGELGLGIPLLTSATSFAQEPSLAEHNENDTFNIANTTDEITLITEACAYIQNAIDGASSIGGNLGLLEQQFTAGRDIFIESQERLRAEGYRIRLPAGAIDLETPPVTFDQFETFEQINMEALAGADDTVRKILAKLLGLFGVSEFAEVFAKLLAADLEGLATAVLAKNWRLVTELFFKIIDSVFSKAFLTLLGENIGAKAAAKIGAKIASRFLPFIGWAILIGQLIWALGEEFGKNT